MEEKNESALALKQKLTFKLTTTQGDNRPVYISGTFNNWKTNDPAYRMQEVKPGKFWLALEDIQGLSFPLEYKYVRGSWESEELNEYGSRIPNRRLETFRDMVSDHVPQWETENFSFNPAFLPKIRVISKEFEVPQLITTRRIAALLPHDYDRTDKRYPVLYLQDGQNLYNEHAPFGNWAVDKRLAVLAEEGRHEVIVISIDHAEKDRIMEFTPTYQTRLGMGDGKKYARFLADTLKPYVDRHFRTLSGRWNTGIGGSSMGALISIYAGLMYPEVFSKLMVFSPSLWVAPNIPFHVLDLSPGFAMRLYLYAGGHESDTMVPNIENLIRALKKKGWNESHFKYKMTIDPNGKHNEACWGTAFPDAVRWLYYEQ